MLNRLFEIARQHEVKLWIRVGGETIDLAETMVEPVIGLGGERREAGAQLSLGDTLRRAAGPRHE